MKKKLFGTYILLLLVAVFTTGILCFTFFKREYKNNMEYKLISSGNLICESLKNYSKANNDVNYFMLAQKFSRQADAQVTFFDDSGKVIADSYNNTLIFEDSYDEPRKITGNYVIRQELNHFNNQNYMYIYMKSIYVKDKSVIVRLGTSLKEFYKLNRIFWACEATAAIIGTIIFIIMGYFFLESIINPIRKLNTAAKQISNGNFDYKVSINSGDEMEELAKSFNIMSSTINDTIIKLKKLEAVRSEFAANVTHELKTPVTTISGFVETLQSKKCIDEAKKKRYLSIISLETQRLKSLIDNILMLSKLENVKGLKRCEQVNVFKDIDYIISLVTPIALGKNVNLDVDIKKNFTIDVCNREWFIQMMLNLIENGIKYNKVGGTVKVIAFQKCDKSVFIVKDTGIGIPKEDSSKIFDRFYRVDKSRSRKFGGTGLGLSIVKNIVNIFEGTIRLNTKENKGSEFVIELPI